MSDKIDKIDLSFNVLCALAEGIRSLRDGDPDDRLTADNVEAVLASAGFVVANGRAYPACQATVGYVNGHPTFLSACGEWAVGKKGDILTFDEEGRIPLRTL